MNKRCYAESMPDKLALILLVQAVDSFGFGFRYYLFHFPTLGSGIRTFLSPMCEMGSVLTQRTAVRISWDEICHVLHKGQFIWNVLNARTCSSTGTSLTLTVNDKCDPSHQSWSDLLNIEEIEIVSLSSLTELMVCYVKNSTELIMKSLVWFSTFCDFLQLIWCIFLYVNYGRACGPFWL